MPEGESKLSTNRQDWVQWPIDASLTMAGITYACQTLSKQIALHKSPNLQQIRSIVPQISTELAVRRWMEKERLPYKLHEDQPFTHPSRPSIILGGRHVGIHGTYISSRRQIARALHNPDTLLPADKKLPGRFTGSTHATGKDLFVFAIYLGLATHTCYDLQKVLSREQPVFLIAVPKGKKWIYSTHKSSLGKLLISAENPEGLSLELVGCTEMHTRFKENIVLDGQTVVTSREVSSLFYIHPDRLPSSDIQIYSPIINTRWHIQPSAWVNLWIYGIRLYFLGWSTWRELQHPSSLISYFAQHHSFWQQYENQCTAKYASLRPMRELIQLIRQS